MADNTIQSRILQLAAEGIKRASGDEGSMEVMSADDLIKLDQYLSEKQQNAKGGVCSQLIQCRIRRPGTVSHTR